MDGAPMFVIGTDELTIDWYMKSDLAEKNLKNNKYDDEKDIY